MDDNCGNCNEPVESKTAQHIQVISKQPSGEIEVLEDWPLCPACASNSGRKLGEFVRAALA